MSSYPTLPLSFLPARPLTLILQALGLTTLCCLCLRTANLLIDLFQPSQLPRFLRKNRSAWALVTGASDGVGLGFAQELAASGFNVVLHGRNAAKLEKVAASVRAENPGCETRIWVCDASTISFSQTSTTTTTTTTTTSSSSPNASDHPAPFFSALNTLLSTLPGPLTALINNLGGTTTSPRYTPLSQTSPAEISHNLALNTLFTTTLTATVLPHLLANAPALVLSVSGMAASLGVPGLAVYSGTKGYVNAFSEALAAEMVESGQDVAVHSAVLGLVVSAAQRREEGMFVPGARRLAGAALRRVGRGGGRGTWLGGWSDEVVFTPWVPHRLQEWVVMALPSAWRTGVVIGAKREDEEVERRTRGGGSVVGRGAPKGGP